MKTCDIYIGRIVSHPCATPTDRICTGCGQSVCAFHFPPSADAAADDGLCVECAGKYSAPAGRTRVDRDGLEAFSDEEFGVFDDGRGAADYALAAFDS